MYYPMSQSPVNPLVSSNYTPQSAQLNNNVHPFYTTASPMSNYESHYPPGFIPTYPVTTGPTRGSFDMATGTVPYSAPENPYTSPDMPDIPSTSTSALALDLGLIFTAGGQPSSGLPTSQSDGSMLYVPAEPPSTPEAPLSVPTARGDTISDSQANKNGNDSMAAPYEDVEDVGPRFYDKSALSSSPIPAVIPMHNSEDA
ncbi:hypothetical protein EDB84DRAFT_1488233 [Lactarius hengduanensis]|nr:hypothetical protein EDB84DRAFT_1488233 [Lactarius hengduanensis]